MPTYPEWCDEPERSLLVLLDSVDGGGSGRGSICIECIVEMRDYDRETVEQTVATLTEHGAIERSGTRLSLAAKGERVLRMQPQLA